MVSQLNVVILSWVTRHPRLSRGLFLTAFVIALVFGSAVPAHADTQSPPPDAGNVLNNVTDSKGIPADRYEALPYDRGGLDNIQKLQNSWLIDLLWSMNTFGLKECLWLFQWCLSFEWVNVVTAPATLLANGVQAVMGELSIIPIALAVTAIVCGLWLVRGKFASGWINLGVSILFAILATGVLANPVGTVVGPNGAIHTAADWGGEVAVRISTDGDAPDKDANISDMIDSSVSQQLVDIFLRVPAQLVSFGKVLEGDCVAVFDNAMKAVKAGDGGDNSVRDAVAACDPEVKQFIDWPQAQTITLVVVGFAQFLLFGFACFLVLLLFVTVIFAAYKAISLIWKAVLGIFPTADRSGVWYALFDVIQALAFVAGVLVFLTAYLRFIIMYMKGTAFMGLNQFVLVDALFIGGFFLLWKLRKSIKKSARRVAERLTKLGGGAGAAPKDRRPVNPIQTAASLARTYSDLRALANRVPARKPKTKKTKPAIEAAEPDPIELFPVPSPSTSRPALTAGNSKAPAPTGSGTPVGPGPSALDRVRSIAASGGRAALQIASYTPTPIGAAARAAQTALGVASTAKRALPGSSRPPALPAGPTAPRSAPRPSSPTIRVVGSDIGPQTPAQPARTVRNERLRAELAARRGGSKPIGS